MGCTIPGCGASDHNRRTHDRHVPPQTDALLDQPETGEPVGQTGADRAREALAAARAIQDDADGVMVMVWGVEKWAPAGSPAYAAAMAQRRKDAAAASPVRCTACDVVLKDGESFLCSDCSDPGQAAAEDAHDRGDPMVPGPDDYDPGRPDPTNKQIWPDAEPMDVAFVGDPQRPVSYPPGIEEAQTPIGPGRDPLQGQKFWCKDCNSTVWGNHIEGCAFSGLPIPPWRTVLGADEPIRITLPGVYDLTADQYHDTDITGDWLSNSDAKKLLETCPAQFDYDRRNKVRKTSDAFDFGHVWHNRVLGKGEAYQVFEPKKLDGRTVDGKAQKRAVDECRAAGVTPIYGDQFALIEAMAQAIEDDPVAYGLMSQPGRSEVCLFWYQTIKVTNPSNKLYGQMVQVKRRAMIDHLPDMPEAEGGTVVLVDGKTADEVKPDDQMRKKIYDYRYHAQADTYAAGVEALFNRVADVVFIFQSKKPPHLIVPVELDTPAMRVAAAENRQVMEIWAECVATGEWPSYTKEVAMSGVPAWIERLYDDEIGDI